MTLVVIHDTDKQVAALLNIDPAALYVPTLVGPDAAELLDDFAKQLPGFIGDPYPSDLTAMFRRYVEQQTGKTWAEFTGTPQAAPAAAGAAAALDAAPPQEQHPEAAPAAPGGASADTDPTAGRPSPTTGPDTAAGTTPGTPPDGATTSASGTGSAPAGPPDSPSATPPPPTMTKDCPVCNGAGELSDEATGATGKCEYCAGAGKVAVPA